MRVVLAPAAGRAHAGKAGHQIRRRAKLRQQVIAGLSNPPYPSRARARLISINKARALVKSVEQERTIYSLLLADPNPHIVFTSR